MKVKYVFRTLSENKESSCKGKIGYNSKEETICGFKLMCDRRNYEDPSKYTSKAKINIYECVFCKKWHYGHSSGFVSRLNDPVTQLTTVKAINSYGFWTFLITYSLCSTIIFWGDKTALFSHIITVCVLVLTFHMWTFNVKIKEGDQ